MKRKSINMGANRKAQRGTREAMGLAATPRAKWPVSMLSSPSFAGPGGAGIRLGFHLFLQS
jgi:hypothetical protein